MTRERERERNEKQRVKQRDRKGDGRDMSGGKGREMVSRSHGRGDERQEQTNSARQYSSPKFSKSKVPVVSSSQNNVSKFQETKK